jgi:hypothetical protein
MRWPDPKDYRCPSGDRHDEEYGEMTLVGQKNSWLGHAGILTGVFHTRWKCKSCGYEGVNQYAYPA